MTVGTLAGAFEGRAVAAADGEAITVIGVGLSGVTVGIFVFRRFEGESVTNDSTLPPSPSPSPLVPVGVVLSPSPLDSVAT